MRTYPSLSRRRLLQLGAGLSAWSVLEAMGATRSVTPAQTEGPFYPLEEPPEKDVDLSRVAGHADPAQGQIIQVRGRVLDPSGQALAGAAVEIWQANSFGKYAHPYDPSKAPLDPGFQGWGQTLSNTDGTYGFKTILPGAYAATPGWMRPPHIHFKIRKTGFRPLTTQMYFPGQALNDKDRILQALDAADQARLIARAVQASESPPVYHFDIVLGAKA